MKHIVHKSSSSWQKSTNLYLVIFILFLLNSCTALLHPSPTTFEYSDDTSKSKHTMDIPKNLDECLQTLQIILSKEDIEEIKHGADEGMAEYHMGLGMWIRNEWGLWNNSQLAKWFNSIDIHQPDDMSAIILTSFYRHLNSRPIDLDGQVKYYRDFWESRK